MMCCAAPGSPLDAETRAFFELRFGRDFSAVRIHADSRAAESARAVNALAYTVGNNIAMGTNQYTPRTEQGKRLLAHELVHVMQQSAPQAARGDRTHYWRPVRTCRILPSRVHAPVDREGLPQQGRLREEDRADTGTTAQRRDQQAGE